MNIERIVTRKIVDQVKHDLHVNGMNPVIERLIATEPELWNAIVMGARHINDLLAQNELAESVRSDAYTAARWTAIVAVESLHRGFYELWRGTHIGTLLEQIDPNLSGDGGAE
jgi:hypothetical protein